MRLLLLLLSATATAADIIGVGICIDGANRSFSHFSHGRKSFTECLQMCANHPNCLSVTYRIGNNCSLNVDPQWASAGDFGKEWILEVDEGVHPVVRTNNEPGHQCWVPATTPILTATLAVHSPTTTNTGTITLTYSSPAPTTSPTQTSTPTTVTEVIQTLTETSTSEDPTETPAVEDTATEVLEDTIDPILVFPRLSHSSPRAGYPFNTGFAPFAASGVAVASFVTGTVGGAPFLGTIAVLTQVSCGGEEDTPLPWVLSPVGKAVGSGEGRYELGAIVFNAAVVAVYQLVFLVAAFPVAVCRGMDYLEALSRLRSPGLTIVPWLLLAPGVCYASFRLLMRPNMSLVHRFAGAFCVAVVLAVPWLLWALLLRGERFHAVSLPDPRALGKGWACKIYKLALGGRVWISEEACVPFVSRWGPLFAAYGGTRSLHWFPIQATAVTVLCAMVAVRPVTGASCAVRGAGIAVLLLLYAALCVRSSPHAGFLSNVSAAFVALIAFLAAIFLAAGSAGVAGALFAAAAVLVLAKALLDAVACASTMRASYMARVAFEQAHQWQQEEQEWDDDLWEGTEKGIALDETLVYFSKSTGKIKTRLPSLSVPPPLPPAPPEDSGDGCVNLNASCKQKQRMYRQPPPPLDMPPSTPTSPNMFAKKKWNSDSGPSRLRSPLVLASPHDTLHTFELPAPARRGSTSDPCSVASGSFAITNPLLLHCSAATSRTTLKSPLLNLSSSSQL